MSAATARAVPTALPETLRDAPRPAASRARPRGGRVVTMSELLAHDEPSPASRRARRAAPDCVAGARLVEMLGHGPDCTVWRAVRRDGTQNMVHVLDRDAPESVARSFQYVARRVQQLQPRGAVPGVLAVHDVSADGRAAVTELNALGSIIDLAALEWDLDRKLELIEAVARILARLHARGLACGYLWPGSVLLDDDFNPNVTALGAAGGAPGLDAQAAAHREPYLADEVAHDLGFDARADIYSFGKILEFLLTDEHPRREPHRVPHLDKLAAQPCGLVRIIRKCTCAAASHRYQAMCDVLTDLQRWQEPELVGLAHPAHAPCASTQGAPRFPRRQRRSGMRLKRPELPAGVVAAYEAKVGRSKTQSDPRSNSPATLRSAGVAEETVTEQVAAVACDRVPTRWRVIAAGVGVVLVAASAALGAVVGSASSLLPALVGLSALGAGFTAIIAVSLTGRPCPQRLVAGLLVAALAVLASPVGELAQVGDDQLLARGGPEAAERVRALIETGRGDFAGAVLQGASLPGVDLNHADLEGADLRNCDLSRADLSGAVLSGADLSGAVLTDTDLTGAVLDGATLPGAIAGEAIGLEDASCDSDTTLPDGWRCEAGAPARSDTTALAQGASASTGD